MVDSVSVIIVTHNSEKYLTKCIAAIEEQTIQVQEVVIVDCGSTSRSYLEKYRNRVDFQILEIENIGFSKANNLGFKHLQKFSKFIVFLNPDTFLSSTYVENAVSILSKYQDVGAVSGKLLGFDIENNKSTNTIDSTGIFRKYYGRWYDRGQNEMDLGNYSTIEKVPALCGALLFCRNEALSCLGSTIFDPDFFLYKEDIEICLRLRKKGWFLLYHPELIAEHCRGWNGSRKHIPYEMRKMSAGNEILLYKKHPSPYILWAVLKYFLVVVFRM